jgi:Flp pilus assembly protein TadB
MSLEPQLGQQSAKRSSGNPSNWLKKTDRRRLWRRSPFQSQIERSGFSARTKNSLWINQSKWFLREERNMTDTMDKGLKKMGVTVSKPILAIIAILFGILVIVFPSLLVWIVGLYFIIQGILLLLDYMELRRK